MTYEADAVIGVSIGNAIARLTDDDYERVTKALECHEATIRLEPDGDSVVIHIDDVPVVRVDRLAFCAGRDQAPRN